jgi:hypothetical protein
MQFNSWAIVLDSCLNQFLLLCATLSKLQIIVNHHHPPPLFFLFLGIAYYLHTDSMLNLLDWTLKFRAIAIFVILDLQIIFHAWFLESSSSVTQNNIFLVPLIHYLSLSNWKLNWTFCMAPISFYIKKIIHRSYIFFEDLSPYIFSWPYIEWH